MTAPNMNQINKKSADNIIKKPKINWLKGKLSWRVISSVFATIVVVQGMILYFTAKDYRQLQLNELSEAGKSAVSPLMGSELDKNLIGLTSVAIQRLTKTTPVRGVAFYEPGKTFATDIYGEPPLLIPHKTNPEARASWLNADNTRYEISFGPKAMQSDYVVVIRLDSSFVKGGMISYIIQSALISFLLSAFITTVLILVLGKWMIEPILMLRNNLMGAAKDPANPMNFLTRYHRHDELGSVISSANKLIKQNADNLARINQQAQDKIYRVAFFDALTELPNRAHFLSKLDEYIVHDQQEPKKLGILVMDIDQFGDINKTLGYESGDKLLKAVGDALTKTLPNALLIARLGEDEFAAILNLPADPYEQIKTYMESITKMFSQTFNIKGNDLVLEGTSGMALWPNDADRAIELLKKAESALDQAKQEEKGSFRLYSSSFEQNVQSRIQMVGDLRLAIEDKQFSLVYQPQFCAKTHQIIGAEALLRWEKPDPETGKKSFVRPDQFISIAEQSGLIVPIGRWVVEEACKFAKACQDKGIKPFRIAVNLSGIQFHRDDVISLVRDVLNRTGLQPHFLELEVTESAVMKDIEQTIDLLKQLKNLGVELAIDDFGTGYSSLSYLKRFPVNRLKVDRSFIMHVTDNAEDASITSTIIHLGHAIGLKVIAEGVETEKQMSFLAQNGCDEFQGYLFSKPLPPSEFQNFAKDYISPYVNA